MRGLSWSMLGAVGQSVLQLLSIVVLARLLPAEEFGLAVAATVVMSLAVLLGQLGIGPALVQTRQLRRTDVATAFSLATGVGLFLASALYVLAPTINGVVNLPDDSNLLKLLSIVLLLGGPSAVAVGLLQRHLRFRELMALELVAYGAGYLGTAVTLAANGFGAVSLVWGQIAQAAITALGGCALARPAVGLVPLRDMIDSGRRVLGFGSAYSLSQVGNWVGLNGDNLVVTSALGPTALGIYSRAYQLLVQPANLIGTVADRVLFPSLSRIQHDPERLARAYVRAGSLVALVTMPISVLLVVLAPEIVAVLLGPGWSAVTLPLQILSVVLMPRTAYKISGSLTRATGAVLGGAWRQWLYAAEVVVGCAVGSHWGVAGVAAGASAAIVAHFGTMLLFSGRIAPGLVVRTLRAYAKSLPVAGACAVVSLAATGLLRGSVPDLVVLGATAVAGLGAAGSVVLAGRRLFRDELGLWTARGTGSVEAASAR